MYFCDLTNFYVYLTSKLNPDTSDLELKDETKKRILERLEKEEVKD